MVTCLLKELFLFATATCVGDGTGKFRYFFRASGCFRPIGDCLKLKGDAGPNFHPQAEAKTVKLYGTQAESDLGECVLLPHFEAYF